MKNDTGQSYISIPVGITPARPAGNNIRSMALNMEAGSLNVASTTQPEIQIPNRDAMWAETMRTANLSSPQHPMVINMTSCKAMLNTIITSKFLVAVFIFLFTILLLLSINPPIVQKKTKNGLPCGRSPVKILVWSLMTALLAFLIPYFGYTPFKQVVVIRPPIITA